MLQIRGKKGGVFRVYFPQVFGRKKGGNWMFLKLRNQSITNGYGLVMLWFLFGFCLVFEYTVIYWIAIGCENVLLLCFLWL